MTSDLTPADGAAVSLVEVTARLAELTARLDAAPPALGFPAGNDLDWTPLAGLFARGLLNNLGDPDLDGLYPFHTKDLGRVS